MDKILIYAGILLIVIGFLWSFAPGLFTWFGNLPGDIKHQSENTTVFIPITSMIIISVVLSVVFRIFGNH